MYAGKWYDENPDTELHTYATGEKMKQAMVQLGPERNNPEQHATPSSRAGKFLAKAMEGPKCVKETEKAKGWMNVSDGRRGVATGIKNFMKEYPKGLENNPVDTLLTTYLWPDEADPMSFERMSTELDGGMLGNFAQGITKTTELIYYFHRNESESQINQTMDYALNPPVAHTTPAWYTRSEVYGKMAPLSTRHPEFENALQYKYDWWAFNQDWEPWYGMFDYGDGKSYYYKDKWIQWTNNEPTVDFMLWTNFMRTGDPKYYHLASAMSKHTMDVDNVHWPKKRTYVGANNDAIDFWNYEDEPESTPYLGIGRRHAADHWYALLSAHVWIQGWIASYYLSADHRALDVAKMTGDTYLKRIWGDHDLRGRRLYLSVLNMVELYDATKLERYGKELDERVELMLEFQQEQGGNLLLDRYGYSQTYAMQGLYKYYQLTNSEEVKQALIDHATWVRKVPPYNHEMESYLATIYPLLLGYEFTGRESYLDEAKNRAEKLKVDPLPKAPEQYASQEKLNEAMLEISNLPRSNRRFTNWEMNQGLRVFGWTHGYNIPYLLYYLDDLDHKVVNR